MIYVIVGSGAREHVVAEQLALSGEVTEIIAIPGNPGIEEERLRNGRLVECIPIGADNISEILKFLCDRFPKRVERKDVIIFVGSEDVLAAGLANLANAEGFKVYGHERNAMELEANKSFAQRFMEEFKIPHARGEIFTEVEPALDFIKNELGGRGVVKWPYLVKGKGAFPCEDILGAKATLEELLTGDGLFKTPPNRKREVVVQEFLIGYEVSLQAVFAGDSYVSFDMSQDHKRELDGDKGRMTGGMGAFSPTPFFSETEHASLRRQIFEPILNGCSARCITLCGTVFPGIMMTKEGPRVLEINMRNPDPESEVTLPRLETDLALVLHAAVNKQLDSLPPLHWDPRHVAGVVMASGGYPGPYYTGKVISGLEQVKSIPGVKVYHAGTASFGSQTRTNGGRVLVVTAIRPSLQDALAQANHVVQCVIDFDGKTFRRDIGQKALSQYVD
ncbi:MAG: phosphoribosylamine--glycine ligase [bacterium]|nr:phosphoribosylamine--glycine ligase [bacterium]